MASEADLCQLCGHKRKEHTYARRPSAGPVTHLCCPVGDGAVAADEFDPVPASGYYSHLEAQQAKPQPEPGHPEFHRILAEMKALHAKKAADYGAGADVLANCRASEGFGVPAWLGVAIRMNDKMTRIKSLACNGELKNESVEDSFMDLACYAIIALILYREATAAGKGGAS
jgi:hypothetical protein